MGRTEASLRCARRPGRGWRQGRTGVWDTHAVPVTTGASLPFPCEELKPWCCLHQHIAVIFSFFFSSVLLLFLDMPTLTPWLLTTRPRGTFDEISSGCSVCSLLSHGPAITAERGDVRKSRRPAIYTVDATGHDSRLFVFENVLPLKVVNPGKSTDTATRPCFYRVNPASRSWPTVS